MNVLSHRLHDATQKCAITNNKYISPETVDSTITLEKVKSELPRSWRHLLSRGDILERKIEGSRKVIALLVYMGENNWIETLLRDDLNDNDLPLSLHDDMSRGIIVKSRTRDKVFATFSSWDYGKIRNLIDQQWLFWIPEVDFTGPEAQEIVLDENCVLPFHCEEMSDTEFSQVYKCTLKHVRQADFSQNSDNKYACAELFAVKRIRDAKTFNQETENLNKIQKIDNPHLIKHLAICKQASFIVFPWANGGNLGELWKDKRGPQQDPKVFTWFLKQIVGLAHALECLHDDSINCRHGDLKPANILNFKQQDDVFGTLKIADLGVSRIHFGRTISREGPTETKASTFVYEAPEASISYPDRKQPRSRTYDSWSFGCVVLEFVVWLLHRFETLEEFKNARASKHHSFYYFAVKSGTDGEQGQYLPQRDSAVDVVIEHLKRDERCVGTALEEIVEMVDKHLLVIKPTDRKKAVDIHESLGTIVRRVESGQLKLINLTAPSPQAIPFW